MTHVFLSITTTPSGETRVAAVNFADRHDGATFEPTVDGLRALGRFLAERWPDRSVSFSSDLDFPHEAGVALTSDEIFAAIEAGEETARPDYGGIGHLFT
jgi:hypothetical protein